MQKGTGESGYYTHSLTPGLLEFNFEAYFLSFSLKKLEQKGYFLGILMTIHRKNSKSQQMHLSLSANRLSPANWQDSLAEDFPSAKRKERDGGRILDQTVTVLWG